MCCQDGGFGHIVVILCKVRENISGRMHLPDAEAGGHPPFLKKNQGNFFSVTLQPVVG